MQHDQCYTLHSLHCLTRAAIAQSSPRAQHHPSSCQRGAAALSDLTLTTSSEALLSGKAPTFRLLVWAVESNSEPVPYVTYVVSESFVVGAG